MRKTRRHGGIAKGCMTVLALAFAGFADEPPTPRLATLVPDPSYDPKVGDVLTVYRREAGALQPAVALEDAGTFQRWVKAFMAKDDFALKEMESQRLITFIDSGTQVRILEIETRGIVVARQRVTGLLISSTDLPAWRYYAVRALDGPLKDKQFVIDKEWVKRTRLVEPKAAKAKARTPTKTVSPPDRAATLLKSGQNLERVGNDAGAIDFYRQVVKEYPKSPQARSAAERIKAIGK